MAPAESLISCDEAGEKFYLFVQKIAGSGFGGRGHTLYGYILCLQHQEKHSGVEKLAGLHHTI